MVRGLGNEKVNQKNKTVCLGGKPKSLPLKRCPNSPPDTSFFLMYRGYFPLWRKIVDWGWYKNSNTKSVFIHLLLKANFKESYYLGHKIYKGQCVTGRKSLSSDLGLSEMQIRTALKHLKSTNEITTKNCNKFSIITLNNFDKHLPSNQREVQSITNKQPASNQQVTTSNNDKKDNNVKKGDKALFLEFVYLTEKEFLSLIDRYGKSNVGVYLERLNNYIGSKGKKYKSHYHTLLNWLNRDNIKKPVYEKPLPKNIEGQKKVNEILNDVMKNIGK